MSEKYICCLNGEVKWRGVVVGARSVGVNVVGGKEGLYAVMALRVESLVEGGGRLVLGSDMLI